MRNQRESGGGGVMAKTEGLRVVRSTVSLVIVGDMNGKITIIFSILFTLARLFFFFHRSII
jgi:hypothetical protein